MRAVKIITLWLSIPFAGCTIADEDRCLEGYTWEEDILSCRKNQNPDETDSTADTAEETDTDVLADAGLDSGTDTDVEDLPIGIEEPCTSTGNECAAYPEANHCLVDPRTPDAPGFCTIADCEPGGCPTGYLCCDCFIMVNCLSEVAAETAVAEGCSCS